MKLSLANRTHALLVLSGALATTVIGIGVFFSYSQPAPLASQQPSAITLADVANTYIQKYGIRFGKEAPLLTTFTCAEGASDPLAATTTVGLLCRTVDMSSFRDKTKLVLAWKKDTVSLHTFTQVVAGSIVAGLEKKTDGVGSTYTCGRDVTVSTPLPGTRRDCTLTLKDSTQRFFNVFFFKTKYSSDTSFVLYTYNSLVQDRATYTTTVRAAFDKTVAGLSGTQSLSWLKYFAETAYAQDPGDPGSTGDTGDPASSSDSSSSSDSVASADSGLGDAVCGNCKGTAYVAPSCPAGETLVTTYDCNAIAEGYVGNAEGGAWSTIYHYIARYPSMKREEATVLCDRDFAASIFAPSSGSNPYGVVSHGVIAELHQPYACVASCTLPANLGGGTLADGSSVTAYEEYSVASPGTCSSQVRTCTDGVLSGTYDQLSCAVTTKGSCGNGGANSCATGNAVSSSGNALDGYTWYCNGTPSIATYRSPQCSYKPVVATWSPAPDCTTPAPGDAAHTTYASCSTGTDSDCTGTKPSRACPAGEVPEGPSASLSVAPTTINYSESATLSYSSHLVTGSCSIDNGVGAVPANVDGTKVVRPLSDTTYTLSCSGAEVKRATVLVAAGLIAVNSPTCTIPSNGSTCSAALTWSSHHFSAPFITNTSYTSPNGSAQPVTLTGPGTVTYALRNGSFPMDSKTVTASCATGSEWDDTKAVCVPLSSCVANTGTLCASDANSCDQTTTGKIGCDGKCSAVTPSDARCSGTPPLGIIDSATSGVSCGLAKGWAYDPDNSYRSIEVHLYVDGPAGSGTGYNAGATNKDSTDVNNYLGITTGTHRFEYQLPPLSVGTHTVHAYAIGVNSSGVKDNQNPEMGGSPKSFTCDAPPVDKCVSPLVWNDITKKCEAGGEVVWTEYCTMKDATATPPHPWQIWKFDNSSPINYEYVRLGTVENACVPTCANGGLSGASCSNPDNPGGGDDVPPGDNPGGGSCTLPMVLVNNKCVTPDPGNGSCVAPKVLVKGVCVTPDTPPGGGDLLNPSIDSFSASPARVRTISPNNRTTVSWSTTDVTSCSVTRNNTAWETGTQGSIQDSVTTRTIYTITCDALPPQSATVNVVPEFQEF